jgi:TPP-dependent pyruvate/acetoin dehydrogenase alpha subunit
LIDKERREKDKIQRQREKMITAGLLPTEEEEEEEKRMRKQEEEDIRFN